jgi:hypothetical protein
MSDFFGPAQMLDEYKNMVCNVDGSSVVVSLNKYRNRNNPPEQGGTKDAWEVREKLRAVAPDAWRRAGGSGVYAEAFVGKGAPRTIAAILETFAAYSGAFIKAYAKNKGTLEGRIAASLANENISWQETLQQVCDACFGLDCNGFIGNWLKIVQPDFKFNQDVKSNDVRAKAVTYRNSFSEIEYWDIMCYAKNEHIAAIHDAGHGPGRFQVVQCAGGGPRINEYAFLEAGKVRAGKQVLQKFKLGAPTARDIGSEFFVVSLW